MWPYGWHVCLNNKDKVKSYTSKFVTSGEMGVDLFFILSGFLIAYGLLKEVKKNEGYLDYGMFVLNRYTRLIWVIIAKAIYIAFFPMSKNLKRPDPDPVTALCALLFISNFAGKFTELWSVSMEMQFYLVSPCIVMFMYRLKLPLVTVLVISLIAWICSFGLLM